MAIPVNDKLVTVEALKTGLDTKPNATNVYTKTETYTKAETNAAIAQSTALLKGVDIPLVSNSVAINHGTVQVFTSTGISSYKFVDLYFEIQGGRTNAVRLWPNYTEKKYKFGFFAWNDTDNAMRRVAVTFTSAGRYMDQIAVKYSYNDDAFADASNVLYLVKAVGYAW